MNHVEKYYWIIDHEGIGDIYSQGTIELTPHLVNPINGRIEGDVSLNTKYEWWAEFSKFDKQGDDYQTHYSELDCGGDTAEEAVGALYELVLTKYGE